MATEPPQTPSFRRLYLRPDSPLPDSPRFRRRLATIVPERYFAVYESRTSLGHFMESQFGIEVPHYEGMGGRVFKFEDHFLQAHIDDVLESITAIARWRAYRMRGGMRAHILPHFTPHRGESPAWFKGPSRAQIFRRSTCVG